MNYETCWGQRKDSDFVLSWPVEDLSVAQLKYPLDPMPRLNDDDGDDTYYELELHFANDYVYPYIGTFETPLVCACGKSLEYFDELTKIHAFGHRIARMCGACGRHFDPTGLPASGQSGLTGEAIAIPNAAAYRFALVAHCGKAFGTGEPCLKAELKTLVEKALDVDMFEAASWH